MTAEKTEKEVTVITTEAKSLALPRGVDGVNKVKFVNGEAKVSPAIAAELKQHYPNLVRIQK